MNVRESGTSSKRPWGRSSARRRPCSRGKILSPSAQRTRAGLSKPRRRLGGLVGVAGVDRPQEPRQVAAHARVRAHRLGVRAHDRRLDRPARGPAVRGRKPLHELELHGPADEPHQRARARRRPRGSAAASGGNFSNASHEVSTSRPIRSGWRPTSDCATAPPVSFATIVTSSRSSAGDEVGHDPGHAGQRQVGVLAERVRVRPERKVRNDAAVLAGEPRGHTAPEIPVDPDAVDKDHRRTAVRARGTRSCRPASARSAGLPARRSRT